MENGSARPVIVIVPPSAPTTLLEFVLAATLTPQHHATLPVDAPRHSMPDLGEAGIGSPKAASPEIGMRVAPPATAPLLGKTTSGYGTNSKPPLRETSSSATAPGEFYTVPGFGPLTPPPPVKKPASPWWDICGCCRRKKASVAPSPTAA